MHKLTNFRYQSLKLFKMVTFGREKFLRFLSSLQSFWFQNLLPIQRKLEMIIPEQFQINFVYF